MSGMRQWVKEMYCEGSVCRKWNPAAVEFVDWMATSDFPPRASSESTLRAFMRHVDAPEAVKNGFESLLQEYYHAMGRKTFADVKQERYETQLLLAELEAKERLRHQSESFGRRSMMKAEGAEFFDRQYEGA